MTTFVELAKLFFGEFISGIFGHFCVGINYSWLCQIIWTFLVLVAIAYVLYRIATPKSKDKV